MVPRTVRLGGGVLLAVFAVAIGVHALTGEFASTLLVYGAAVVFVMAHGPALGGPALAAPDKRAT